MGTKSCFFGIIFLHLNYQITDEKTLMIKNRQFKYIITIDEDIKDKGYYNNLLASHPYFREQDRTIIFADEKK